MPSLSTTSNCGAFYPTFLEHLRTKVTLSAIFKTKVRENSRERVVVLQPYLDLVPPVIACAMHDDSLRAQEYMCGCSPTMSNVLGRLIYSWR
jgi:hypothetical protein